MIIEEIRIIRGKDRLHFLCSVCNKVALSQDYVKMFLKDDPNGCCIHERCLLRVMKVPEYRIK